jgi:hypothetical protein
MLKSCLQRYDIVYLDLWFPRSFNGSSCLLGQGVPKDQSISTVKLLDPKDEDTAFFETSATVCHSTRRKISENLNFQD